MTGAERFAAWLPSWINPEAPVTGRVVAAVGERIDGLQSAVNGVRRARFIATAPEWALAFHAARLRMPRVPGEEVEAWRRRLLTAWELFQAGGTRRGMERALERVFGVTPVITEHVFTAVPRYGPTLVYGAFAWSAHRWSEFDVELPAYSAAEQEAAAAIIQRLKPATRKLSTLSVPTSSVSAQVAVQWAASSSAERGDLTLYGPGTLYGDVSYGATWSPL